MIRIETIFVLMGLLIGGVAIVSGRDHTNPRRWNNAIFWGAYAVTFLVGSMLPDVANGVLVLIMVGVAGIGKLGTPAGESATRDEREASAPALPRGRAARGRSGGAPARSTRATSDSPGPLAHS